MDLYTVNFKVPKASEYHGNNLKQDKIEKIRKLINKPKMSISPIKEEMNSHRKDNSEIINSRQNPQASK